MRVGAAERARRVVVRGGRHEARDGDARRDRPPALPLHGAASGRSRASFPRRCSSSRRAATPSPSASAHATTWPTTDSCATRLQRRARGARSPRGPIPSRCRSATLPLVEGVRRAPARDDHLSLVAGITRLQRARAQRARASTPGGARTGDAAARRRGRRAARPRATRSAHHAGAHPARFARAPRVRSSSRSRRSGRASAWRGCPSPRRATSSSTSRAILRGGRRPRVPVRLANARTTVEPGLPRGAGRSRAGARRKPSRR